MGMTKRRDEAFERLMDDPQTCDENGWLTVGFAGNQKGLGET